MKKFFYFFVGILLICGIYQACAPELPGTIYGTVVDKATGEPIKLAGVELSPVGLKTVTGSEGQFQFDNLMPGSYTLLITKTGYVTFTSNKIEVVAGQTAKGDVQIEKLPPALKVVNDKREEISTLDFGSAIDDVARSFNIFNDGDEHLEWQITTTAEWIKSISKTEGVLSAGATQSLIVTIDRTQLGSGENKTTLHITSNNGSKQLTILAMGKVVTTLKSLPATDIKSTSATLNGEILIEGNPKYTELGFVYSDSSMPTISQCIKKVPVPSPNNKNFSATTINLTMKKTYYARAYAIQDGKEVYSTNEVIFVPKNSLGKVETTNVEIYSASLIKFEGNIIEIGEPIYTECGFVYGANSNPTIDNSKKAIAPYTGKTGIYSMQITDPDLDVLSYVRAYIINDGEPSYGKSLTFRANSELPRVDKPTITEISPENRQATFKSYITYLGSPAYTEVGFVYHTSSNPTLEKGTKIVVNTNGGQANYHITVSELTVNTTYYVRAFITNEVGTYYSDETNFNLPPILPTIGTLAVTNLTETSAILNGQISTEGEPAYTERGFCLSTLSSTPTITSSKSIRYVEGGNGVGNYSIELNNLDYKTEYYYRTYALQSSVVTYGNIVKFTTLSPPVSLSGTIKDDVGIALKNVIVRCGGHETVTDANGDFTFDNLEVGQNYITASRNGYKEYSDHLDLSTVSKHIYITMNIEKELYYTPSSFSYAADAGMEGTSTHSTLELTNMRDKDVQFTLSNLPSKGIVFKPSSGVIPANSSVQIEVTFTYPSPNNGAVCFMGTWYGSNNQKYTKTYAWGWESSYASDGALGVVAHSEQSIRILLNPTNGRTNFSLPISFSQHTIWP